MRTVKTSQPSRILRIVAFAIAPAILAFGLPGCVDDATTRTMAEHESVLAPLFKQGPTPMEAATWAGDPYDSDKRARGTLLLANAPFGGAEAYLTLYREHLKDSSAQVQAVAIRALALHGTPDDVPRILPLITSPEKMVRLEATRAMQRLYNPVAVPALVIRLDSDKEFEPEIRAEAATALGQYAELKSLTALIGALADSSLLVNTSAYQSLKTLTGVDSVPADLKAWVQWKNETRTPFAGQRKYVYPVYWRETTWMDHLPFRDPVPNEIAATPVGFPDLENRGATAPAASGAGQVKPQ